MSDGGQQGGITVQNGIGREKLGLLYMDTIKTLPRNTAVDFTKFRDLVLAKAMELFGSTELETIRQSFKAVGL